MVAWELFSATSMPFSVLDPCMIFAALWPQTERKKKMRSHKQTSRKVVRIHLKKTQNPWIRSIGSWLAVFS
jgi:hypothetical protein